MRWAIRQRAPVSSGFTSTGIMWGAGLSKERMQHRVNTPWAARRIHPAAELRSPPLLASRLRSVEAALVQARANVAFAKITAQRMHTLFKEALVAQQDDDQARTQASVSEANVKAATADIEATRAGRGGRQWASAPHPS